MRYEINGTVLPSVDVWLEAGESVFTESGGMAWMKGDIRMETNTKGGLLQGLGRSLAGESLFMTTYTCERNVGMVTFTPESPGRILAFELAAGQSLICQKDAFMAAQEGVHVEIHFRKRLGAGFFGGEGFILQKITGPGLMFVEIAGDVREYNLQSGEVLKVDPGHIGLYEPTVDYDITTVKGLTNILFSGEGLFLATLRGPGKVWLQSMPLSNLVAKILKMQPSPRHLANRSQLSPFWPAMPGAASFPPKSLRGTLPRLSGAPLFCESRDRWPQPGPSHTWLALPFRR
jgi:uncharacterized protein (TIGR00266 family)